MNEISKTGFWDGDWLRFISIDDSLDGKYFRG